MESDGEEVLARGVVVVVVVDKLREGGAGVSRLERTVRRTGRRSRRRVAAAPAEQETVGGGIAVSRLCRSVVAVRAIGFVGSFFRNENPGDAVVRSGCTCEVRFLAESGKLGVGSTR